MWARQEATGPTFFRIEDGEVVGTDLGRALDGLSLPQVVGVGLPDESNRIAGELVGWVRTVNAEVQRAVPGLRPPEPALLFCPADEETKIDRPRQADLLRALVVLVPEDLSDPAATNYLMAPDDEAFVSHVAHALACLAGIWGHETSSSLGEATDSGDATARLVRCHTRIVDAGYLADHLAAEAFTPGPDGWPNPDTTEFERGEIPDDVLDSFASGYMTHHRAVLGRAVLPEDREEPGVPLLEALRRIVRYVLGRLVRWPFEMVARGLAWFWDTKLAPGVERLAPRSGVRLVRFRKPPESKIPEPERPIRVEDGAVGPAWRELVSTPLALLDGGELSTWIDREQLAIGQRRLLEADPRRLAPNPDAEPPLSVRLDPRHLCDPRVVDPLVQAEIAALVAAAQEIAGELATALRASATGGADQQELAAAAASALGIIRQRMLLVRAWYESLASTFLWRVARRILREIAEVTAESVPPTPEEWAEAERLDAEARKSRPRRWWRLVVRSVVLGLVVLWGIWGPWIPDVARPFVVVGAFALWWILAFVGWWRRHILETAAERAAKEYRKGLLLRARYSRTRELDRKRLERRYEEFVEWADLASRFAHRPWTARAEHYEPAETELRERGDPKLPQAAGVAYASLGAQDVAFLAAVAQTRVFRPGWLTRHLTDWVERAFAEWTRRQPSKSVVEGAAAHAWADTSRDADSLRRFVVDLARRGALRAVDESPAVLDFLEAISAHPFAAVVPGVVDSDDADEPTLPPPPNWFEAPTGLQLLAEQVKGTVVGVAVATADAVGWGTGVVVSPEGVVATNRHVVEQAAMVELVLPDGARRPAEVARLWAAGDLALLRFDPPPGLLAARQARLSNLVQGTPVFTLGYPFFSAESGEPSLSWGIVAAHRRWLDAESGMFPGEYVQLNYPAGGGASGSPVFNLAGELVAIHAGGSTSTSFDPRGRYISFAVPAEDLWKLLEEVAPQERPGVPPADQERVPSTETWTYVRPLVVTPDPCQFGPYGQLTFAARSADERMLRLLPKALENASEDGAFGVLSTSDFTGPIRVGQPIRAYLTRIDWSKEFVLEDAQPGESLPWFELEHPDELQRALEPPKPTESGLGAL